MILTEPDFALPQQLLCTASFLELMGILDRDRRVSRNADDQALRSFSEFAGLRMPEKQAAQHFAFPRFDRSG